MHKCELCGDNEGPKYLHSRCHLTAPLQASLEKGVLTLRCYIPECNRVVTKFRVTEILPGEKEAPWAVD